MQMLERIGRFFKTKDKNLPKDQIDNLPEYPSKYTLSECIEELTSDGFTVSHTLQNDIKKYGLADGIVLVHDGSDGLRVMDLNGVMVIKTYNELSSGKSSMSRLAIAKYDFKPIILELSSTVDEISEASLHR